MRSDDKSKGIQMINRAMAAVIAGGLLLSGAGGCSDSNKSSVKQETKISTPKGTTTITTEKEVKKTGDAP